ncbi:MAG TPA: poly-gamma-glutamate hydrolase family protein [Acidimicrobiia bacterium]|nr:poly-gamma-glutamate hydrolase family protein [Acidimicrobiia bacterium]
MFDELLRQPGVIEEWELRSTFGFLAIHGGSLERGTAEVATAAAAGSGASVYAVRQPEDLRWHIPSALVDPSSSTALSAFLEHVDVVVSVHGYGRRGYSNVVLIGGRNRELATRAADVLRSAVPSHRFVDDLRAIPPTLRGVHLDNPVNRTRGGGIQLELPPTLRDGHGAVSDRAALVSALTSLARPA